MLTESRIINKNRLQGNNKGCFLVELNHVKGDLINLLCAHFLFQCVYSNLHLFTLISYAFIYTHFKCVNLHSFQMRLFTLISNAFIYTHFIHISAGKTRNILLSATKTKYIFSKQLANIILFLLFSANPIL